jgi:multidrug resistance efflux pump
MFSLLIIALVTAADPTEVTSREASRQVLVRNCQVFFLDDVDVPAEEAGRLIQVAARVGDLVASDQLLARIDDRPAQLRKQAAELERSAARVRAEDDIEVRFSVASFELAEAELNQDLEINRKTPGVIPAAEIRRKRLAQHRAELQIDRSKLDQKVAGMTAEVQTAAVQTAEESIRRCQIQAPFDGTVIDLYRQQNEWVNAGDPVLRVVRLDRLHVDGFLDSSQYNPSEIANRPVTVEVELARGRIERFVGKVIHVSPQLQAGNRYRFRAEVENRQVQGHWLLQAGANTNLMINLP